MKEFLSMLPEHKCELALTHNQHKSYYESVEEYISNDFYDWKDEETKKRAIETDEIWTLQWYPDTPVGSFAIAAPTLAELLEFAKEE